MNSTSILAILTSVALASCGPKASEPFQENPLQEVSAPSSGPSVNATFESYVDEELGRSKFQYAEVDLNSDGLRDYLVLARDNDVCGTGGCTLYAVAGDDSGYRTVSRSTVVNAPIWLLDTETNGWRDLAVMARFDAERGWTAKLPFDGQQYATNPTVPPSIKIETPTGMPVIDQLP